LELAFWWNFVMLFCDIIRRFMVLKSDDVDSQVLVSQALLITNFSVNYVILA
jgi:hypothetical protein